jgi:hypothetical protein
VRIVAIFASFSLITIISTAIAILLGAAMIAQTWDQAKGHATEYGIASWELYSHTFQFTDSL